MQRQVVVKLRLNRINIMFTIYQHSHQGWIQFLFICVSSDAELKFPVDHNHSFCKAIEDFDSC